MTGPHGTSAVRTAEIIAGYHNICLTSFSQIAEGIADPVIMIPNEGNAVGVFPPFGASVAVSSDWGPVRVTVELGGEPPAPAATSAAVRQEWVDHSWCGTIEFDHPKFFVSSFDQFPEELSELVLPRGPGRYAMAVTWSYQGGRPVPPERPVIGEVIPHSDGMGAYFIPGPDQPPLVLTDLEMANPASEKFWESLRIRIG